MILTELEKAYVAGLFDGEGSVYIVRTKPDVRRRKINPGYHLEIEIGNTNRQILEWIKLVFGGHLHSKGANKRPCFAWRCGHRTSEAFLRTIEPYTRIKADQITVALKFRAAAAQMAFHMRSKDRLKLAENAQRKEEYRNELRVLKTA